jgi:hypothetical protein
VFGGVEQCEKAEVYAGLFRRGLRGGAVGGEQRYLPGVAELERPGAGGDDALVAALRQAEADGVLAGFISYAGKKIRGATSRCRVVEMGFFGRV